MKKNKLTNGKNKNQSRIKNEKEKAELWLSEKNCVCTPIFILSSTLFSVVFCMSLLCFYLSSFSFLSLILLLFPLLVCVSFIGYLDRFKDESLIYYFAFVEWMTNLRSNYAVVCARVILYAVQTNRGGKRKREMMESVRKQNVYWRCNWVAKEKMILWMKLVFVVVCVFHWYRFVVIVSSSTVLPHLQSGFSRLNIPSLTSRPMLSS